jgi:periplasmic protein TonB
MNLKHYTTPAIVAAAAHAALFLLAPDVPATIKPTGLVPVGISPPPRPDDPPLPPEPDLDAEKEDAGGPSTGCPPMAPEAPAVVKSDFEMPAPPVVPRDDSRNNDIFRIDPKFQRPGGSGDGPGGTGPLGPIRALDLDHAPRYRARPAPDYPFAARQAGQEGEVLVDFLVDGQGRVASARVVRSSDRIFEEPALRAVRNWRFEPGRRDGRVVAFRLTVPLVFKLSDDRD